ncbi:MAG: Holliday junction branch migration protein RuvA [Ruminococcaceae bacterium]|nr:Holliday junction branch migration protein RuvA [Oscillospiraceae bacterium]
MFYYISGALTHLFPNTAVVNAGGVGFKLTVSNNTYDAIAPKATKGEEVRLYTYMAVREDGMELFGFATESELDMFKLLITVSGVGPKAALAILSAFTPEKFILAVSTEDRKAISRANGIGPKTAARIILELRDKLLAQNMLPTELSAGTAIPATAAAQSSGQMTEAQEALLVLGYSRTEILNALQGINTSAMSVEDIIRAALKKLM